VKGRLENSKNRSPRISPSIVELNKNDPDPNLSAAGSDKALNNSWVASVIPISIATGPVSTLIVLLILSLHGNVVDVGFAITLFNAVSIPAAIFWGFTTDRLHRRKMIIIASYTATGAILLLFLFARSLYSVTLLYGLFSFVTTAETTPLNLLVMETSPKQQWSSAFAWFSMLTSIGNGIGLVLGSAWSSFLLLNYLVIPLALLSLASAGLSVVMIKEPSVVFERQMIVQNKHSFFQRLQKIPFIFLRIPTLSDFKRIFRAMKYDLTKHVPLLYLSIFMFYVASGLFNTSVVASMGSKQVSSIAIFSIVTVVNIVQTLSFKYAGVYAQKTSLCNASIYSLTLRGTCYALLGISFYFVGGTWYAIPALVFYSLAGGLAYSIYYTASNTMVFNTLHGNSHGSSLGVYSALVGIATMAGALMSGFSSYYLGFGATFLLAGGSLGLSIWLIAVVRVS